MAMALIRNPESLLAVGNNNYQLSFRTAVPAVGTPGTGGRGAAVGGAVESSNVDITAQLVNMITAQRNFQANAQMISTEDSITQTIINIR